MTPEYTSDVMAPPESTDLPNERQSMQSEISMIRSTSHGSITYPYRSLLKDISFPRYHFMSKPGNEAEAFTGSLGMLGHGVPLWNPIGDLDRPKEQLDSSISIGDVGFLSLTGEFKCYFNIFLPPESKYQTLCPQDLIPLAKPLESELCREDMHFAAGTALVSNGIEASILSSSPLDIQFTVHTREGGILVLPDGASREDLISTDCIRDYVQKNILGWYMFFNEKMGGPIYSNGTLYVVTGTDKAVRWASCLTYPRETKRRRIMNPSTIIYRGARGEKIHYWEENTHTEEELMWKRYRGVDIDEVKICTLFLRGMRFAVNERDWSRCILYYETPDRIPYSIVRTMPALGLRAKVQTFKERRPSYSQKVPYGIRAFFHPLDVILHLLLKESPSSSVAFLEDHIWCAVVDKSDANRANIFRLLVKILETHEISANNGLITLLPKAITAKEQQNTASKGRWIPLPVSIKRQFYSWRNRRRTLSRLSQVFPGLGVPPELLSSTRLDQLD